MESKMIREIQLTDAPAVAEIYNYYIEHTSITFEEEIISSNDIESRIKELCLSGLPWLVIEENSAVVGYAYASKWKGRCAYRFSVETTVYLSHKATTKGLGSKLYTQLFSILKEMSIHIAIGGISLPNPASIALHEKFGMKKVAHFEEVGFKFGSWVDVGYWQVNLNA